MILALDVSTTKIGFAVGSPNLQTFPFLTDIGVFAFKGKTFIDRIAQIPDVAGRLRMKGYAGGLVHILIEAPVLASARSHKTLLACYSGVGVMLAALRRCFPKVPIALIPVSSWRSTLLKGVFPKGKMPRKSDELKEAVKKKVVGQLALSGQAAFARMVSEDKGGDIADACGLLYAFLDYADKLEID